MTETLVFIWVIGWFFAVGVAWGKCEKEWKELLQLVLIAMFLWPVALGLTWISLKEDGND